MREVHTPVKSITSGKVSVDWKMKALSNPTKNGFVVLSSDEEANAGLLAGAWIGSNQITLFENDSSWGNDLVTSCRMSDEVSCQLDVNLDLRSAVITINGKRLKLAFSETFTAINYIGFGVHNAETLFSDLKVRLVQ